MPAPRLHHPELMDQIVNQINQDLSGPLNLKVVAVGSLEFYPAIENLKDNVPAIFVEPAPSTDLERITTAQTYRITYNTRLVYVRLFSPNEEIIRQKTIETQQIGEHLIDQVNLGNLSLPNGQILFTNLQSIEWKPPEDQLVATINADMTASALVFSVQTTSRK